MPAFLPTTPGFWAPGRRPPALLKPLSALYGIAQEINSLRTRPEKVRIPVICIGNLVAGGAGKTPVTLALAEALIAKGRRPHILSRGFGRRHHHPLQVALGRHTVTDVGDEPLLLAKTAPTWVGRNRMLSARAAIASGADILLMDDGLQHYTLYEDLRVLVVDGGFGFGNGFLLPAGPLREPLKQGFAKVDVAVIIGKDQTTLKDGWPASIPLLEGQYIPIEGTPSLSGLKLHAFAGIARPEKFFDTLREQGAILTGTSPFPDHHPFRQHELNTLAQHATQSGAHLITTRKDWVRLPEPYQSSIQTLDIELSWQDQPAFARLVNRCLKL